MNCKTLLTLSFFMIALSSSAQIGKGSFYLGGNLNFGTSKSTGDLGRSYNISINPVFGKAIKENLMIGFDLGYGTGQLRSATDSTSTTNYTAGVFVRKYGVLGKGFYLFGQARMGFNYFKFKHESYRSDTQGYGIVLDLYPGVAYSVNKRLQLELGLPSIFNAVFNHYQYDAVGNEPQKTTNSFNLGTAIGGSTGVNVGIRLLLNKS